MWFFSGESIILNYFVTSLLNATWDCINDESTLAQVMTWCHQASSHYLSQCWLRSLPLYGVTRPHCVNPSIWLPSPHFRPYGQALFSIPSFIGKVPPIGRSPSMSHRPTSSPLQDSLSENHMYVLQSVVFLFSESIYGTLVNSLGYKIHL